MESVGAALGVDLTRRRWPIVGCMVRPVPGQPLPDAGMLLVATPALREPTFCESVVLLLEVGPHGALGVVLNRPSPVPVGEVLPAWSDLVSCPDVLFRGGPVGTDEALGVGLRAARPGSDVVWEGFDPIDGDLGLVDLDGPSSQAARGLDRVRVFAGYAGWDRDQLDDEVAEGSWYVLPGRATDAFEPHPEALRRAVLRRQPGEVAWLSTRPLDPARN